ncbi:hypothetical protein LX32DRAFT_645951 [Colletotrichum zoysiae]|uniref:Uncharacterized protein n=1 Tax=Colletotrichum zoysiae TaxID=1216348 RepID=A0AAD9H5Y6_9PEZI|nr:hypothetical protein LX32DRAFT_645951 [Colletotrichum zoysiae]
MVCGVSEPEPEGIETAQRRYIPSSWSSVGKHTTTSALHQVPPLRSFSTAKKRWPVCAFHRHDAGGEALGRDHWIPTDGHPTPRDHGRHAMLCRPLPSLSLLEIKRLTHNGGGRPPPSVIRHMVHLSPPAPPPCRAAACVLAARIASWTSATNRISSSLSKH